MNSMRELPTNSHSDAWTKHIKKLSQGSDNTKFSLPVAVQNHACHGLPRKPKWGK